MTEKEIENRMNRAMELAERVRPHFLESQYHQIAWAILAVKIYDDLERIERSGKLRGIREDDGPYEGFA